MKIARFIGVALLAVLAVGQVVRQAFVTKYGHTEPALAGILWPSHPDVSFKLDLDRIAAAAASGAPIPRDRIDHIMARAKWAPLAAEPFLVRGVDAQMAGKEAIAERAFLAAKQRAHRSIAPRYFLADHYLRTNQPGKGLVELGALTRLLPDSIGKLAPYYAAYAGQPGGEAQLAHMFRLHPELAPPILFELANNASNADLVLRLSQADRESSNNPPVWAARLIESLLDAGQFAKARDAWAKISNVPISTLAETPIFDSQFRGSSLSPPFNWSFPPSGSGVVELTGDGRLHIIFYGRDNAVLAGQTLLLDPGTYRLSLKVADPVDASSLSWTISCRPAGQRLVSLSLAKGSAGRTVSATFGIPSGCPAQQLQLVGIAPEFPETVDVAIRGLDLSRVEQ